MLAIILHTQLALKNISHPRSGLSGMAVVSSCRMQRKQSWRHWGIWKVSLKGKQQQLWTTCSAFLIVILWRVVKEANLVLEIVISDKKAGKYVVLVHLCQEKMLNLCWFLIFMWIVVIFIERLRINQVKTVTLTGETVQTKWFLSDFWDLGTDLT